MNLEQREGPRREWRRGVNWEVGYSKAQMAKCVHGHCIWAGCEGWRGKGISPAGPFIKLKFKHFP